MPSRKPWFPSVCDYTPPEKREASQSPNGLNVEPASAEAAPGKHPTSNALTSKALKAAMKRAGVSEKPQVFIFEEDEKGKT